MLRSNTVGAASSTDGSAVNAAPANTPANSDLAVPVFTLAAPALVSKGAVSTAVSTESAGPAAEPVRNAKVRSETAARSAQARLAKYRATKRRIEFFPSPDVLAIIEQHKARGLDPTLAGTIDQLIRAGQRQLSGVRR